MARFEDAIAVVLANEGGYVNDPNDAGGETKYGICKRSYPAVDIVNLTQFDAANIYRRDFWAPYPFSAIDSQPVATKVFDMAVNMGTHRAFCLLQAALSEDGEQCDIDGHFGPKTLTAVNAVNPETLLSALRYQAQQFYRGLAEKKPSNQKFLAGWLKRAAQ